MRILVTFAVETEFAPWRKLREFRPAKASGEFVSSFGYAEVHKICVLLTGIGEQTTQSTLANSPCLRSVSPDLVISSGFAGALKPGLQPGTLIVPHTTRTLKNHANVASSAEFREEAVHLGAVPIETLITLDRLVKTKEEKERLSFFGDAVDMESAIVMSQFAQKGVPTIALRVISDGADEDLPLDFDRCLTPQGEVKPASLVNQIVRRPGNLPKLIRFGRQSYSAAQDLAVFMEKFVVSLPVHAEKVAKT